MATVPVDPGFVLHELPLLRLRALLARAHGDEAGYREFADRRGLLVSAGSDSHGPAHARVPTPHPAGHCWPLLERCLPAGMLRVTADVARAGQDALKSSRTGSDALV